MMETGRSDEARASLQRAVELNPDDADARYNLAHVLATLRQPTAAICQLRGSAPHSAGLA
jgi:thioredoxin-like negative regulator of GroEL